jgi:hypothetical protein
MMPSTAFPATPADVAVLSVEEFTFDLDELDGTRVPTMARVCRTFMNDANRAVVWWIRFNALTHWCERTNGIAQMAGDAERRRDACAAAASTPLNQRWEFDVEAFAASLAAVSHRRARMGGA